MRKVIRRRVRRQASGRNVVGDIQGVIAANVGETGRKTGVSKKSSVRIVQRDGKTEVTESEEAGD